MAEIAGPNRGGGVAGAEVDVDCDFGVLEAPERLVLVEGDGEPAAAHGQAHDVDGGVFLAEGGARLADGHGHAAPVGVVAVDSRLDERGVRDGSRGGIGVGRRGGARHVHGDEARGALAVGGHLAREVLAHGFERLLEAGERRRARMEGNGARRGAAIGEQEARVVRGRIGIDRDLVEAAARRAGEGGVQRVGAHRRIGGEHGYHGGHVRHDHARALRHAAHRERAAVVADSVARERDGGLLRTRVGGHDGARRVGAAACYRELEGGEGDARGERLERQVFADHASGGHQHLGGRAAEDVACDGGGFAGGREPALPRGGVGVAGVYDHGLRDAVAAVLQMLAGHRDGRRAEHVLGEHGRACARLVGGHERKVEAVGVFAEARMDAGRAESARRGDAAALDNREGVGELRGGFRTQRRYAAGG